MAKDRAKPARLKIDDLAPAPYNPRGIKDDRDTALGYSLAEFGDLSGITFNRRTRHLVTGHQRLRNLKAIHGAGLRIMAAGITTPDGEVFGFRTVDWPLAKEKAANVAANNPLIGGYFTDDLAAVLADVAAASPDYMEALALDDLLASLGMTDNGAGETEEDDIPDVPEKAVTKPGDVWTLGDHRLVCGNAADAAAMATLGATAPSCMWTDPPYGVSYVGKTKKALTIDGDNEGDIADLVAGAFTVADGLLAPGAAVYVSHPPGALSLVFGNAFVAAGWRFHETLVWVKDSMVLGHSDYHYRHEPIIFGYKPGTGRRGRGGKGWYGGNAATSIFEIDRPKRSEDHPTAKPVELVAGMLSNSTKPGAAVYDPFVGSGTTLIAADQLGRTCFAADVDPLYCDVVVTRWEQLTGGKAKRKKG